MNAYYDELKSKNNILDLATELGYNGSISGSSYQGSCPRHRSTKGRCLVIWPGIQAFKCYHCLEKGDVINLVQLYKRCDHQKAVNYLADRAGMSRLSGSNFSKQEQGQIQAEIEEKKLVEDILTQATDWYHQKLMSKHYVGVLDHLEKHYGFSKEIIEELQIGFSPPGTSSPEITSDLAKYLENTPGFKGKLALSGLFTFKNAKGPFWDFFRGRIIFPYWKGGKVVYMTARAMKGYTPEDQYECYVDKEGNVKIDDGGNPDYVKYKKLRTHNSEDEKRKHISRFIQNDVFMGEDTVRGAKEVIITEGAPDWVSAVDNGFSAISPVTTRFREKDWEKLERLTVSAESIYLINDNEENRAGFEGALKTGKHLTKSGKSVSLVELPRPSGVSKIDLNEYLVANTADDLRKVMDNSKSVLDLLIDELPENFIKALPAIKSEIAPIISELEGGIYEYYIDKVSKKAKGKKKYIEAEIELALRQKKGEETQPEKSKVDPSTEKAAEVLAREPDLLKKRIDIVNKGGVVGERYVIAMYFAALDSRLLPEDEKSPNVLAIKNAGHFGAGKSYTLLSCLAIYPKSGYHLITNGSAKSLYYRKDGLKHHALVVTEGFQFQTNNAGDSEFVYVIRSLISEGRVSYEVPEKSADGTFVTVEKKIEGPTSFITTTIMEKLEPQFEDRLFTIHPDESVTQTKDIIMMKGRMLEGQVPGLGKETILVWKTFHKLLQTVKVVVPFASLIAEFITKGKMIPITTRRAFNRVMAVVQTVTCTYQFQRSRDEKGNLISEIADYYMALQIVEQSFNENLGRESKGGEERISYIEKNGPLQSRNLKDAWGITNAGVSQWIKSRVTGGIITWCDENGEEYTDDNLLKKAKRSGKAYIKVTDDYSNANTTGLPTPFELTGDAEWEEGGKLWVKYDLNLQPRGKGESAGAIDKVTSSSGDVPHTENEGETDQSDNPPNAEESTLEEIEEDPIEGGSDIDVPKEDFNFDDICF